MHIEFFFKFRPSDLISVVHQILYTMNAFEKNLNGFDVWDFS